MTDGSRVYYYGLDGHGSVVNLTDHNGVVTNQYRYDPYGNPLVKTQNASIANPWRYAGGFYDSESSLYLLGARYYWPAHGLFLQQDPLGAGGNSQYAYAASDPCNNSDPSGMKTCSLTVSPEAVKTVGKSGDEMMVTGVVVGGTGMGIEAAGGALLLVPGAEPEGAAIASAGAVVKWTGTAFGVIGGVFHFASEAVQSWSPQGLTISYQSPSIGPFSLPCPPGFSSH